MKKIMILANSASGLYDFRNELLLRLLEEFEVHVALPDEQKVPELVEEGCIVHHTPLDRRGMNPVKDLGLMKMYMKLLKSVRPDCVLTYTIKPNIYGNICCRLLRIPYIVNITGLGSVFEREGMIKKLVIFLFRRALKEASCIFFQNNTNRSIFESYGIKGKSSRLVPGSGVNLDRHRFEEYSSNGDIISFLYVGRIMKEKGSDELLYTASEIKKEYPNTVFKLVGYYEDDYQQMVEELQKEGVVEFISYQKDVHPLYKESSAVIVPSYHEGMSNVILEAASTGRPVIATNIPGCREGFDDDVTGISFEPRNKEALLNAVRKFLKMSYDSRVEMGKNARRKMENEFDRSKVVNAYLEEINKVTL